MIEVNRLGKSRFLVLHDYGMGGLWWWIWARSAEEIRLTLAETEVITDADTVARMADDSLDEVDIDDVDGDPALTSMRQTRIEQRDQPGFGALAGRSRTYLRLPGDTYGDSSDSYLVELDTDGRRLRMVDMQPNGVRYRSDEADWLFNPPFDLYRPQWATLLVEADEFEKAWEQAVPDPAFQDGHHD